MPVHLCAVYGSFHTTTAKLNSCHKNCTAETLTICSRDRLLTHILVHTKLTPLPCYLGPHGFAWPDPSAPEVLAQMSLSLCASLEFRIDRQLEFST